MANEFEVVATEGHGREKRTVWRCKQCQALIRYAGKPRNHICGSQSTSTSRRPPTSEQSTSRQPPTSEPRVLSPPNESSSVSSEHQTEETRRPWVHYANPVNVGYPFTPTFFHSALPIREPSLIASAPYSQPQFGNNVPYSAPPHPQFQQQPHSAPPHQQFAPQIPPWEHYQVLQEKRYQEQQEFMKRQQEQQELMRQQQEQQRLDMLSFQNRTFELI